MKRFTLSACVLATAIGLVLAASSAIAQDLAVTAGKNAKVLLDNDQVRVIEVQLAPGEKTGMHSHPRNLVYFLTDGSSKQSQPDGTSKDVTRKAGEVLWSEPVTHDTVNMGKAKMKALVIELKGSMPEPAKEPVAREPTKD
jgi:quercetin dioxygenase-like cupin family protein